MLFVSSSVRKATCEGGRLEFLEVFKLSRAEPVQVLSVWCGRRFHTLPANTCMRRFACGHNAASNTVIEGPEMQCSQ